MLKEDTRKQATIVTLKSLEYEIKLTHVLYNLNQFCPEFFYIYMDLHSFNRLYYIITFVVLKFCFLLL